jgi:hypothetical protein
MSTQILSQTHNINFKINCSVKHVYLDYNLSETTLECQQWATNLTNTHNTQLTFLKVEVLSQVQQLLIIQRNNSLQLMRRNSNLSSQSHIGT